MANKNNTDAKMPAQDDRLRVSRWYFGGLSSAGAACITHPLDLLKVQMQTQRGTKVSLLTLTGNIVKQQGIMGLYNGISASLLRQFTYSMSRFGIYEISKQHFAPTDGKPLPLYMSAFLAGLGGAAGGFIGAPADMVNVRMQNDIRLPAEQRRNYRNAFHGLWIVYSREGISRVFSGTSMATLRAILMTIGQLSFYDLVKASLLGTSYFSDNVVTHITSSLFAGAIATTMTQPVDVLKTRAMNAKPGEFKSMLQLFRVTAGEGLGAFFKGYIPAFARLAPHTILMFVFLEQMRIKFGYFKPPSSVRSE